MRADFWDIVIVVILWAIFAAICFAVIEFFTPFPVAAAEEAHLVDEAFTVLTRFAVPVFTFVIAVMTYSIFRFQVRRSPSSGTPPEDGAPVHGHRTVILGWFGITSALTLVLIVFPGISGILELRALDSQPADVVVQVQAQQFRWIATYPEEGVFSRNELVLPVDEHVVFNVTAIDVIHAFWIPAFRIKIDAVPGMTTRTAATPDRLGDFNEDVNYRLQCAEMCGFGHNAMAMPVRVVERAEYEAWVDEQTAIRQ